MKTAVLLAAVSAASLANAKPHGHGHAHRHHKRVPDAVTVQGPVSTELAFVLNGQTISKEDVCKGIQSGELNWEGAAPAGVCDAPTSIDVPTPTPTPSSTTAASATAGAFYAASSSSAAAPSPSADSSSSSTSSKANSFSGAVGKFVSSLAQDDYEDFPDGVVSCADGPPRKYGAVPVDYLGMGGWNGLQQLNSGLNSIVRDASSCSDLVSCSYSCAPGYQIMQWITNQPSNGASVGGLICKGGMLYKANSNSKLCGKGVGGVSIQNNHGGPIAACRTAYPATEAQTVPLDIASGDTQPLTCPDEENYYKHLGSLTSAQYYLNNPGFDATQVCSWQGTNDGASGNWAAIVLGVGATGGTKWLSIFQNNPTSNAVYQGNVKITGTTTSCEYKVDADGKDGTYCGNGKCCKVSSGNNCGCTASTTGDAVFVVS